MRDSTDSAQDELSQLRRALDSRPVIEQAKGALMLRYGIDADAAFAVLRRWSQDTNIPLRAVAEALAGLVADPDEGARQVEPVLAARFSEVLARRPVRTAPLA